MNKFVEFVVVCAGVWELMRFMFAREEIEFTDKIRATYKKSQAGKLSERELQEHRVRSLYALMRLPFDIGELVAIICGLVFFEGTMRWLMFSVLSLTVIQTMLISPKRPMWLRVSWRYLDCAYCAAVMILGPLVLR